MIERRMHTRAFFTFQHNIPVTISTRTASSIKGTILNISQGGLGFVVKRHEVPDLKIKDKITVDDLTLPEPVNQLKDVETQIKFIIDHDTYARISIGCQFLSIPDLLKQNIQELVNKKAQILNI